MAFSENLIGRTLFVAHPSTLGGGGGGGGVASGTVTGGNLIITNNDGSTTVINMGPLFTNLDDYAVSGALGGANNDVITFTMNKGGTFDVDLSDLPSTIARTETRAPTAADDQNEIGDHWIDTSTSPRTVYQLVDDASGAAVWRKQQAVEVLPADGVSPKADDATGAIGTGDKYARQDHKHPAQAPSADAGNAITVGTDGLHLAMVPDEVLRANTNFSGAAPDGAEWAVNTLTGATFYKDNAGNWQPTPTASVDLNMTVADQAGNNMGLAPLGAPVSVDDGDVHLEVYDDGCRWFTRTAGAWVVTASFNGLVAVNPATGISPAADDATGAIGSVGRYAREDHKHPAQGVSSDAENLLKAGSDGLHMLDPDDLVSADAGNDLEKGSDGKLFVPEGATITHHNAAGTNLGAVPVNAPAGAKAGDIHIEAHDDGVRWWKYYNTPPLPAGWQAELTHTKAVGKTRVFITNSAMQPSAAGAPTDTEAQTVVNAGGAANHDRVFFYNGTDSDTTDPTHAWLSDPVNGKLTRILEPSSGGSGTPMSGATPLTDGSGGTVPAPTAGQQNHVLAGRGQWVDVVAGHYVVRTTGTSQTINLGSYNNLIGKSIGVSFMNAASTRHTIGQANLFDNGKQLRVYNGSNNQIDLEVVGGETYQVASKSVIVLQRNTAPPANLFFEIVEYVEGKGGDSIYDASGSLGGDRIVNLQGNHIDWQGNGNNSLGYDERFSVRVPVNPTDGGGFYDMRIDANAQGQLIRNHNDGSGNSGVGGFNVGTTFATMSHSNNGKTAEFGATRSGPYLRSDDMPLGLVNDTTTDYGTDGQVLTSKGNNAAPEWTDQTVDSVEETVDMASHGFVEKQPIYHNGTNWTASQGDNIDTVAQGVVSQVVSANRFVVTTYGVATITGHGLTLGADYWLDQGSSALTATQPTTGITQPILHVRDTNTVFVNIGSADAPVGEDVRVKIGTGTGQVSAGALTSILDGTLTWADVKNEYETVEIVWTAFDGTDNNRAVLTVDVSQINLTDELWFYANQGFFFSIGFGSLTGAGGPVVAVSGGFASVGVDAVYGIRGQKSVVPARSVEVVHDQNNYMDIGNKRIQWGIQLGNDAESAVSLPQPFANSNYVVTFGLESTGAGISITSGGDVDFLYWIVAGSKATTQFSVDRDNDIDNANLNWTAIGDKP